MRLHRFEGGLVRGSGRDGPRRLCLRRANSEPAWFCGDDGSGLKLWTMHTQDLE